MAPLLHRAATITQNKHKTKNKLALTKTHVGTITNVQTFTTANVQLVV